MVRALVLGSWLAAVWLYPRVCEADPIRVHPSISIGASMGSSTEKVTCSTLGEFECPLPDERKRSLGLHVAPHFEALVMVGRSTGFRLGVGVRYLPGFALDAGSELHFALVPEALGRLSRDRYVFAHLFNSLGYGSPPPAIRERQRPTLDACSSLRDVEDAHCSSWRSKLMASLGIEIGLIDRFAGFGLRYGVGVQAVIQHNHAVADGYSGNDAELSDDDLYVTYGTESSRVAAFVGVEW